MPAELIVPLIMRWLHILSAIVAVGGAVYTLFVVIPAVTKILHPTDIEPFREAMRRVWQRFIHAAILLLLLSGFYNYLVITRHQHVDQALYHAMFGVKFLLALVVFVLGVGLTSAMSWSRPLRANPKRWLGLLVLLAVIVVMISGFLRTMPKTGPATPPAVVAATPER